jgi:Asp-tRNA(Asn)/Glu-tRNA(Gln) amidotransferase C subunit
MTDQPTVTEEMVEQLARLAQLPLDEERRRTITSQLDGLLSEANRVNRYMDTRREVGPAVRFDHPELTEE